MLPTIIFLAGTAILIWLSRKALRAPGRHGFYRFFAWEAILVLFVLNQEPWGRDPFAPHQVVSWILMTISILLVHQGLSLLRRNGQASEERSDNALYEFEKTTSLVTEGIYRHIRHPMYASLLALAWGAYFQNPTWVGSGVAVTASFFLLLTAKADEQECLAYFGHAYADYMRRTRRFIPGIF
nr:isoprenylcysteine carboxylmethyltransferase family protein [Dechloromonas sp.]